MEVKVRRKLFKNMEKGTPNEVMARIYLETNYPTLISAPTTVEQYQLLRVNIRCNNDVV